MRRRLKEPPEIPDEERERISRALIRRIQWGGIVFLTVVVLGAVPGFVAEHWPSLERPVAVAVWIIAPLLSIALIVVAAVRLRR